MNKYVSRGLWTVLVTGGFMALGVGVANADTGTSGQDGIASGTQGILGIELPIQLGGNAISVLGDASSSGSETAPAGSGGSAGAPAGGTDGEDGLLSGTQILGDLGLPVTLGGNAISVLGDASTSDSGTTSTPAVTGGSPSGETSGADSTLGGSQVLADAGVPVTLGGNAISVLGDASSDGASTASGSSAESDQEGSTSGTDGVLGGTQVLADLGVPVTLGGNAISVLGDASTGGSDTTTTGTGPVDPGDPGDAGGLPGPSDLATAALGVSEIGESALAATGAEGGLTAIAMAMLLLAAGVALVSRVAIARRR